MGARPLSICSQRMPAEEPEALAQPKIPLLIIEVGSGASVWASAESGTKTPWGKNDQTPRSPGDVQSRDALCSTGWGGNLDNHDAQRVEKVHLDPLQKLHDLRWAESAARCHPDLGRQHQRL